MGRIIYTNNIGFDMKDWERESINKVFAGTDCIMAITEDGRVLQKVTSQEKAARTNYWTRIKQLSISSCDSGMVIGLVSDGTCMISKRPLRSVLKRGYEYMYTFEHINETIKGWHDIVQVAVSDAYFALDSFGHVHCCNYSNRRGDIDDYRDINVWKNVKKIVTGSQNSIFGITDDGRVLCAGGNCIRGPLGDLRKYLDDITDAVDIIWTGSECESVYILKKDGSIVDYKNEVIDVPFDGICINDVPSEQVMDSTFFYTIVVKTVKGELYYLLDNHSRLGEKVFSNNSIINSFALGDIGYGRPFVIAVIDDI